MSRRFLLRPFVLAVLVALSTQGFAVESAYEVSWVPISGISDGESSVSTQISHSMSLLVWIVLYPGFWVALAFGSLVTMIGAINFKRDALVSGFLIFIFAAAIRAILQIAIAI